MNNKHLIISDELLSAFLDGNTSADDSMRVLKAAQHDKDLQEIIRIASEVDEDIAALEPVGAKPVPMTAMAAAQKEAEEQKLKADVARQAELLEKLCEIMEKK